MSVEPGHGIRGTELRICDFNDGNFRESLVDQLAQALEEDKSLEEWNSDEMEGKVG